MFYAPTIPRSNAPTPLRTASQADYSHAMVKAKMGARNSTLGDYIRRQRQLANVSLRKVAQQSGISAAVLKEIEGGLRNPSRTIIQSIAGALRLSAETLYLQAGVLDPQDTEEMGTVQEIRRDPSLTQRQRDALIEIYEAFCAVNRSQEE
jgi:transcriptional regulator with XRE-family HTH domain